MVPIPLPSTHPFHLNFHQSQSTILPHYFKHYQSTVILPIVIDYYQLCFIH